MGAKVDTGRYDMTEERQTPEQLLEMILSSDRDKQLQLCRLALDASQAASDCFVEGHTVEIYNLNAHIQSLSLALVNSVAGNPVDPGLLIVADKQAKLAMEAKL